MKEVLTINSFHAYIDSCFLHPKHTAFINRIGGIVVDSTKNNAGLGLLTTQNVPSGSVVLNVPASVALSVETPSSGPDDFAVMDLVTDRRAFREIPWYAQFALVRFIIS